jgi:hypothetical protein
MSKRGQEARRQEARRPGSQEVERLRGIDDDSEKN